MLIARAEVAGRTPVDVRIEAGRIAALGALDRRPGEPVLDAAGGALLPGLHDHHIHLLALAAAEASARCGPPAVRTHAELADALARHPGGEWLRGIGYHESVAGELDRAALDALVPGRPARIQHRSGALWILNSAGLARLGVERGASYPGVERDARGRATGRVFRADAWLRAQLGPGPPPDLAPVGRLLARFGVTGVTDATATSGPAELALLLAAAEGGALPQRIVAMGDERLPALRHPRVSRGALKLALAESEPPDPDALAERVAAAHAQGRAVAFHCATRAELVLATAALAAAGPRGGDRIEHAALAPPELAEALAKLRLTVVTQPVLIHERGDAWLAEVEPAERRWLWRARGLLEAGVALGGGSDAPFGAPDPWAAMRAAVERRTESGAALGPDEALSPERALALFTTPAAAPGGRPRRVAPGAPADLVLLDRPWRDARRALSAGCVRATLCAGELAFQA